MAVLIGDAQRPPEGPSGRHLVANDCPRTSPEAVSGRILAARTIFMPKPNVNRISSLTDSVGIEIRLTFVVWEEAWRSSPSENNTSELDAARQFPKARADFGIRLPWGAGPQPPCSPFSLLLPAALLPVVPHYERSGSPQTVFLLMLVAPGAIFG